MNAQRLASELESFQGIWSGGYFEGDPLNPLAKSSYGPLGFMSVLHATYLRCIKPYIRAETVALEIGPGRGAWTKTLLPAREVYAIDALSAEHNGFFEYLGHPPNVRYFQVQDFECRILPDDHFTYVFSFGCLCHVSFDGISEYAANLWPKLKSGANCFWMVADYEKFNQAVASLSNAAIWDALIPSRPSFRPLKWLLSRLTRQGNTRPLDLNESEEPSPGRWYHAGTERTCVMLRNAGYTIITPDVGTCLRDPIIHFAKP
jgi:hypothetical protein